MATRTCLNYERKVPVVRGSKRTCSQACGAELSERLLDAEPDIIKLLPPGTRSTWRDYKTPKVDPLETCTQCGHTRSWHSRMIFIVHHQFTPRK